MNEAATAMPWQRALVYGLGLSGRAAARLLRARGVAVVAADRRAPGALELDELATDPGIELVLGAEPSELPPDVDLLVLSPGVPLDRPLVAAARQRRLPVMAEVELAFRCLDGPVLGVTGSNGKSTTTALTGALLVACGYAVEVCGNIGRPLSDCVAGDSGRLFVTELSSFQLETVSRFRPRAAALLNISADHLDRHADVGLYGAAKRALFARQTADDVAVLNADDPAVAEVALAARKRWFSRRGPVADGCYLDGERVIEVAPGRPATELFQRRDLPLAGEHNLENAMAAALLARAAGAAPERLRAGLASFRGLPHRLERVATINGVGWYNDSKATNLSAAARSLEGFAADSVHLILGGRHKGADPRQIAEPVRSKARRLYLIGEAAELFRDALGAATPHELSGDLATAMAAAGAAARPGEVVVLSPACASFDQYDNFEQRGDEFRRLALARLEGGDA
jgi:UDP-N-acetylmuramoylalanine--D-glutamate ligase